MSCFLRIACAIALATGWVSTIAADPAQVVPRAPAPAGSGDAPAGGRIILDQPVKAGGLMLFPVVGEPNSYLYAPMTPHLARDAKGRPEFSFIRYVKNVEGSGGADAPKEGMGGGVLSALITLDVPDDQLRRAQQDLERQRTGAKIIGPAIFRSGTFALVSVVQEGGKFASKVIGVGNAPVFEGAKAGVSMDLTQLGAQLLWESFHMSSPDIKFAFDMKLPGFWSPAKATIVANLEQVYSHEAIKAAVATPQFEFTLNQAFDELMEKKSIKIEVIGGDADFQTHVTQVHDLMTKLLFDKSAGIPDPGSFSGKEGGGGGGSSGEMSPLQKQAEQIRKDNLTAREKGKKAELDQKELARLQGELDKANAKVKKLEDDYHTADEDLTKLKDTAALAKPPAGTASPSPEVSAKEKEVEKLQAEAKTARDSANTAKEKADAARKDADKETDTAKKTPLSADADKKKTEYDAANTKATDAEKKLQTAKEELDKLKQKSSTPAATSESLEIANKDKSAKQLEKDLGEARTEAKNAKTALDAARTAAKDSEVTAAGTEQRPAVVGFASYELKKVKREGEFRYSLDKYSNGELPVPFNGGIGDLTQYLDDPGFFRQANLDDPMYKQREIAVYVDGMNSEDFGKFVNFVTVQMRKTHQNGAITLDEVRIDRKNFNAEGNRFRMIYGWKGDDDRNQWLQYEWRAIWSFFGGQDFEEPWRNTNASGIRATPPYQIRSVSLEADPENVKDVRSTTVRLYYDLGGKEQMEQVTLNTSRGELSTRIPFMLPFGQYGYGYDVTWRLRGNRSVSAPRAQSNEAILYVDEVPEAE